MHFSYYSIVTSAVQQWNSMEICILVKPLWKTFIENSKTSFNGNWFKIFLSSDSCYQGPWRVCFTWVLSSFRYFFWQIIFSWQLSINVIKLFTGICCDDDGRIIVADSKNQRVLIFSAMLEFLWSIEIRPSSQNILTANIDEKDRPSDVALLNGNFEELSIFVSKN